MKDKFTYKGHTIVFEHARIYIDGDDVTKKILSFQQNNRYNRDKIQQYIDKNIEVDWTQKLSDYVD